jgi:hypothetical protein
MARQHSILHPERIVGKPEGISADLIRRYMLEYPNVKLARHDLYPVELDQAFDRGEIDIAITRALSRRSVVAIVGTCRNRGISQRRTLDAQNGRMPLGYERAALRVQL